MCIHYARMRIVFKNVPYRLKAAFPKCLTATDSSFTVVCQRSSSRESACSFCCCCCLMACNSLFHRFDHTCHRCMRQRQEATDWWPGLTKCQEKAHSDEVIKELVPSFPTGTTFTQLLPPLAFSSLPANKMANHAASARPARLSVLIHFGVQRIDIWGQVVRKEILADSCALEPFGLQ